MKAMSTDTWEARMAERSRARTLRQQADARSAEDERARAAYEASMQRPWLNGWYRTGNSVRIGTGVHCVCCGRCMGITCTVFPPDWEPPGPDPVWPFAETDCPLCVIPPSPTG